VHLVEPEPTDGTDPLHNYQTIRDELEKYDPEMVRRPEIVAVTKADLPAAEDVRRRLAETLGREVLLISAVTGLGLNELVGAIAHTLQGGDDETA
jgi:GTP-binding protein